MKPVFLILMVIALVTLWLFAYLHNRQAQRNDDRRDRLAQRFEELLKLLKKKGND